jgi:innexin
MVWNLEFLGFVKHVASQPEQPGDDDAVDRLNHRYTFAMIMIFLVLIAGKQYVGQPIECWVPKEFSNDWQAYTENYCWIKSTYWVPMDEEIPEDKELRHQNLIGYYQWVPFILLGIALSFNIPRAIWRLSNWHAGIKLQNVIVAANGAALDQSEKRDESIKTVINSLEDVILQIEKTRGFFGRVKGWLFCIFGNTHRGTYLTSLYVMVKLLYLINIAVQLYMMTQFLGTNGFKILHDLACGKEWHESGHFPRVTMCDFAIRGLGQKTKNFTVQCVLMINLFNEKIFLSLWLWYMILLIIVAANFIFWIVRLYTHSRRVQFIRHMLKTRGEYENPYKAALEHFVKTRLVFDGIFILYLIQANAGEIVATDVVVDMWQKYKRNNSKNESLTSQGMEGESASARSENSNPPLFSGR